MGGKREYTEKEIKDVKNRRAAGQIFKEIAIETGIPESTIKTWAKNKYKIKSRKTKVGVKKDKKVKKVKGKKEKENPLEILEGVVVRKEGGADGPRKNNLMELAERLRSSGYKFEAISEYTGYSKSYLYKKSCEGNWKNGGVSEDVLEQNIKALGIMDNLRLRIIEKHLTELAEKVEVHGCGKEGLEELLLGYKLQELILGTNIRDKEYLINAKRKEGPREVKESIDELKKKHGSKI